MWRHFVGIVLSKANASIVRVASLPCRCSLLKLLNESLKRSFEISQCTSLHDLPESTIFGNNRFFG
jgi:hypothetical protein